MLSVSVRACWSYRGVLQVFGVAVDGLGVVAILGADPEGGEGLDLDLAATAIGFHVLVAHTRDGTHVAEIDAIHRQLRQSARLQQHTDVAADIFLRPERSATGNAPEAAVPAIGALAVAAPITLPEHVLVERQPRFAASLHPSTNPYGIR